MAQLEARRIAWFDYYVKGVRLRAGGRGRRGGRDDHHLPQLDPLGGTFHADSWAELAPGEIRFRSTPKQTIAATGSQFGEIFGSTTGQSVLDAPCGTAPAADNPATANYRLDPAPAGGFTLLDRRR